MIENLVDIILVSGVSNIFIIAILIIRKKINIAIGLSLIQSFAGLFRFLKIY